MTERPSASDNEGWRAAVVRRAQHTGDPAPGVTMTLVLGFVAIATFTQIPAILTGSLATVFALVTIAMMLTLLPSVFHPSYGRSAALCRLAGLAVAVVTVIVLGIHLWG